MLFFFLLGSDDEVHFKLSQRCRKTCYSPFVATSFSFSQIL